MKKIYINFTILLLSLLIISCGSDGGSIYAMEKRYKNFLNILPKDIAEDFKYTSKNYGSDYKLWRSELNKWIDKTIAEEKNVEENAIKTISPANIEYAIVTLTGRNYERNNPVDLMKTVKNHSDKLALQIKELEKDDEFSKQLNKLKEDEAIEHFNTDETTFYYLWNYMIAIERPRRFQ